MESFYTEQCPSCETENLVSNGDESDQTRPDVETVRCWNCGKVFWIGPDLLGERDGEPEQDYADEDGMKLPDR